MSTVDRVDAPPARALSREESHALFDHECRRLLGISGEEFIRRWDAGEFDPDTDDRVLELAMILPFGR